MQKDSIKKHLENILNTGYEILFELEENDPSIQNVEKLFGQRGKQINNLNNIKKDHDLNNMMLDKNQKEQLKNLFLRLQLLEKKIEKNLTLWSEQKSSVIKTKALHNKVNNSYSVFSIFPNGKSRSRIIDIKST